MARPSSKKPLKETAVSPAAPKTPQPTAQAPKKPPGRPRKSKPTPGKENTIPSSPLGSGASGPPATSSSDDLQLNLANITNIKLLRKHIAELEADGHTFYEEEVATDHEDTDEGLSPSSAPPPKKKGKWPHLS
ncbi:hypothetical protein CVT26_009685 [Gymnopilus dilepis]|uniref:Uncharacterized protein n=1 Tax=Gymnopilus dilepis TaxID=231916 RepID=A0A409YBU7_9AGAR|nr:hypothetical protein CVT26_009685 [Gymnopilus dilepis]